MKSALRQFTAERKQRVALFSWGTGMHGECGDGSLNNKLVPVRVTCEQWDQQRQGFAQLACGLNASFAVTADGRVFSWGHAIDGRLGHQSSSIE